MISVVWGIDRSETGMAATGEKRPRMLDMRAAVAELVAMTLFVITGCGVACGNGAFDGATRLLVAFSFGMGILVLAYTIGHHSGGQINCAVTFSLVLGGQVPWYQGLANLLAQLIGSILGACFLCIVFPCAGDATKTLGTNIVNREVYGQGRALAGEIFGTFLLCYVVWETAVNTKSATNKANACTAIGFAVFLSHLFLLPIDGCSINPTRSFGPAIVDAVRKCDGRSDKGLEDLWVMWVGPLVGAALATALQRPMLWNESKTAQDKVEPFDGKEAGTKEP